MNENKAPTKGVYRAFIINLILYLAMDLSLVVSHFFNTEDDTYAFRWWKLFVFGYVGITLIMSFNILRNRTVSFPLKVAFVVLAIVAEMMSITI